MGLSSEAFLLGDCWAVPLGDLRRSGVEDKRVEAEYSGRRVEEAGLSFDGL